MKKIFIFISIALMITACTIEVEDYVVDYSARLAVYPPSITFIENIDTSYIEVGSNTTDWIVSSNAFWCKAEKIDSNRVRVAVEKKELVLPDREATITISSVNGVAIRYVIVSQKNSAVGPLVGTWTVIEDANINSTWYNGETYQITVTADHEDPANTAIISGVLPYGVWVGWASNLPVIKARIEDGKITIPNQDFATGAGWWEPDYITCISPLKNSTFAQNAGLSFDPLPIEEVNGKPTIRILGGFSTYSFQVYDIVPGTRAYYTTEGYCRNTVWVKD
jgi:hypothetical protein